MTNGARINIRVTFSHSVSTRYLLVSVSFTNDIHLTVISRRTDAGMLKIANSSTRLHVVRLKWIHISTNPRLGRNWQKKCLDIVRQCSESENHFQLLCYCTWTSNENVTRHVKKVNDLLLYGWRLATEKSGRHLHIDPQLFWEWKRICL